MSKPAAAVPVSAANLPIAAGDAGRTEPARTDPAGTDMEWAARARASLADSDRALAERFDNNDDIDKLLRTRAQSADALPGESRSR